MGILEYNPVLERRSFRCGIAPSAERHRTEAGVQARLKSPLNQRNPFLENYRPSRRDIHNEDVALVLAELRRFGFQEPRGTGIGERHSHTNPGHAYDSHHAEGRAPRKALDGIIKRVVLSGGL